MGPDNNWCASCGRDDLETGCGGKGCGTDEDKACLRCCRTMLKNYAANHGTHCDAENERLRRWVNDLQSGMYINCVYCGHQYGRDNEVPIAMADILKEHIEKCPEHPMSKLKEALREAVAEIKSHNSDYHHVTSQKKYRELKKASE